RWLGHGCLGVSVLSLALHPLLSLQAYYQQETKSGRTNARYLQAVETIKASRQSEDTVLIDRAFQDVVIGKGVGRVVRFFRLAFELTNLSTRVTNLNSAELLEPSQRCRDQFVILAARRTDLNDDIIANLDLRDLD